MVKIKYNSYLKDYVAITTTAGQPTSTPLVEGSIVLVLDSNNKILEHWIWDKGIWKGGELAGGGTAGAPVTVGLIPPTGTSIDGAIHLVTDDGTETGNILEQYIYDLETDTWINFTNKFSLDSVQNGGKLECDEMVLTKSTTSINLNDTYFGWSKPEAVQWANIPTWDNRTWKVWFDQLDTDGIGATSTPISTSAFASFQELIDELNNQLLNYGSSFRLIGHQDGNRILVADLSLNPLLIGDPYLTTYNFQNMVLVIEDALTGSDWLVNGRNPKDLQLSNVDFGVTGYSFKTYQCPKSICEQLKEIPDGVYDVTDKIVVLGQAQTLDVQGWFYDGVNTGNGFMEVPFTSGNQVSVNALIVDGIDYIPGGPITNTYLTFQDFLNVVNGLITASGVQLATSSDNDFYIVGSDSNPISQVLVFDFYDDTVSKWLTKKWQPDTIQIQTTGECKLVELTLPEQGWGLQGNAGTDESINFIGTTDLKPITFKTNNVKRGVFTRNGNFVVGINESLIEEMDTSGFGFSGVSTINTTHNIFNFSPTGSAFGWAGIAAGGSPSAPTIPVSNSLMGATNGLNYDGAGNFRTVCRMRYHNVGQPTPTSMPTKITFSTTAVNSTSTTERMVINEAGNVGIGVLVPTTDLHVQKSEAGEVSVVAENLNATSSAYSEVVAINGNVRAALGAYKFGNLAYFGTDSTHPIYFQTNNTRRVLLTSTGNVGIGSYDEASNLAPRSLLESQGSFGANIRSTSASLTLADNDYTVVFTAIGLVATLPTPSALLNSRRIYNIKNKSTGTLDITGNIDGVIQTITIGAGDSRTFHGDGATWFLI